MSQAGRRAFVTGGASGIGAAVAARLTAEGAEVIIGDLDTDAAERHAKTIGARAVPLDVADPESARDAVGEAGTLDVLVNCAAIPQPAAWFTDVPPECWRRILTVNLEGVFACTQAALPAMQRAGYGRIVNISSEAGRMGAKSQAVYAASKGGVIAFTQSIARENARYGITANAIAPGPIETPMLRTLDERAIEIITQGVLLRRLGTPEEVAAAVAFLASPDASYITGETLGVSGGWILGTNG
jgi:2-hydroxycyclohexanecarboxyl-CoA dehydrogenase